MVKRRESEILRLQHKKFQGVYNRCVPKDKLLNKLKSVFERFKPLILACWSEPDETRPGEWHTHFLIEAEETMFFAKDQSLEIDDVKPDLLRIETKEHLKEVINYSLKSDKNVLYHPPEYPYPKQYKQPFFMRKTNENNTTPESLVSLSTSIKNGSIDLHRTGGSMANCKSIIRMLSKGEPIITTDPPPELDLRVWQRKYEKYLLKKEYCKFEESPETAVPLSRYNIVYSPIPSQGFNFMFEYFMNYVAGTAWIKVDTEDAMAHSIHNVYVRNGLKPIRNIMLRIDDTTIIPKDFDSAMNNFLNKKIIAKVGGYSAEVPTEKQLDVSIFTHMYVPEKIYSYHNKRMRYHILDRNYDVKSVLSMMMIEEGYSNMEDFKKYLFSL